MFATRTLTLLSLSASLTVAYYEKIYARDGLFERDDYDLWARNSRFENLYSRDDYLQELYAREAWKQKTFFGGEDDSTRGLPMGAMGAYDDMGGDDRAF